jgi:hypothetical protein
MMWLLGLWVFLVYVHEATQYKNPPPQKKKIHRNMQNKFKVVIGFFNWSKPSSRTMALGSTQPLTEMSTRKISEGWSAAGA